MAEKGEQGSLGGGAGVNSFQQPLPLIQPFPAHKVFFYPILAGEVGRDEGWGIGKTRLRCQTGCRLAGAAPGPGWAGSCPVLMPQLYGARAELRHVELLFCLTEQPLHYLLLL